MTSSLPPATVPATVRATVTGGSEPDFTDYDLIVVGLSGKDGHAALEATLDKASAAGVRDRVYTAHADLGLVEWPGVTHHGRRYPGNREMVELTAGHYGIPAARQIYTQRTVVDAVTGVVRPQLLLEYIADRGKWPDMARRFCTSDMKTTKIMVALTPHVKHLRPRLGRAVRILNITGMRADESPRRRDLPSYSVASVNQARQVDDYLPVHAMTTAAVRDLVDASGLGHHWAYDSEPGAADWEGMSRLSCSICILSNKSDLILAVRRRPRLAALYAEVETSIDHHFRQGMPVAQIIAWAAEPGGKAPGVVLEENTPEFDEFAAAVRARLAEGAPPLRGGTGFNPTPLATVSSGSSGSGSCCGSGC
jgi:3'-phosphoadenosine 5'-phosphosulfate sulfotransferase (PAPS reductase)/FAD synthetase